ncbi:MAG: diguanylate cyclase [Gaiellales bacterium]|nr:MAG: diguanylate cyclase [Gaiellales bacterium]
MTDFPLCDLFQITPKEVFARRAFLDLTDEDERHLATIREIIQADLDKIVGEFYDHLLKADELKRFLSDRRTVDRLQATQRDYLLSLGRNADQLQYFEDRLKIGITHERVGLKQKWYLGAYAILFEIVSRHVGARYVHQPNDLLRLLSSFKKIVTLDMVLAVETYYQATTQRLEGILQQLTDAQQQLQEVSRLDGLTQVSNRRFLMESLEVEWHRSVRFTRPFTLLLVDLDDFKRINDEYGHRFGDFVLQRTVAVMRSTLRPADLIGRYGGEEFAIGLVETDGDLAKQIAERLRLKIALSPFESEGQKANVTASIGVASVEPDVDRVEMLIERADQALYQAKSGGRNQVCIYRRPYP